MRCTQFGDQVPRRNSAISVPRDRKPESERIPSRFAAGNKNSCARADGQSFRAIQHPDLTLGHKGRGAACEKLEEPSEARATRSMERLFAPLRPLRSRAFNS